MTIKEQALAKYYSSPNLCNFCGKVIPIPSNTKPCFVRLKKYCNRECMGMAHAKRYQENRTIKKIQSRKEKHLAKLEREKLYLARTKEDCLSSSATRASGRIRICKHARDRYKKLVGVSKCFVCGYDKYTEVCHKKSVSSFPGSATLDEINSVDNLISLCPNCHWEFDHGLLKL